MVCFWRSEAELKTLYYGVFLNPIVLLYGEKTVSPPISCELVRGSCKWATHVDARTRFTTCNSSSDHLSRCRGNRWFMWNSFGPDHNAGNRCHSQPNVIYFRGTCQNAKPPVIGRNRVGADPITRSTNPSKHLIIAGKSKNPNPITPK